MKLLVIANPKASSVNPRKLLAITKVLSTEHSVTIRQTERRGDGIRLARATEGQFEVVIAFGGYGTLNEIANGLATTPDLPLAVLPGGSTNVFARAIGFPNDLITATHVLLGALRQRLFKQIGAGSANGRYFLCNLGVGFDAAVVCRVEQSPKARRIAGASVFVGAALQTWLRHNARRASGFRLQFTDGSITDGHFTVCQNLHPYTFLGRRALTVGDTEHSRGLSALTFRDLYFRHMAVAALSSFGRARYLRSRPWIDHRTEISEVEVSGDRPFPYQLDGDYLGETDNLSIIKQSDALTIVLPVPHDSSLR